MAWLNDIAGKAEDFLNKIDNSAASVLSKEKKKKHKIKSYVVEEESGDHRV